MDIDAIREETRRAFEEAGEAEPDLAYIDEPSVREVEQDGEVPPEHPVELVFKEGGEAIPGGVYLHDVFFTGGPGSLVYGKGVDYPGYYRCYSWNTGPYRWQTRTLVTTCRSSSSKIWRITQ